MESNNGHDENKRWYINLLQGLIVHGDDDQIVPIGASALHSSKLVKDATLKIYKGAPHGLADTHKDTLNKDLLAFLKQK